MPCLCCHHLSSHYSAGQKIDYSRIRDFEHSNSQEDDGVQYTMVKRGQNQLLVLEGKFSAITQTKEGDIKIFILRGNTCDVMR